MGTLHFGFPVVNDCEKTTFVNSLIVWKPNIQGRHRRRTIPPPAAGRIGELAEKARLTSCHCHDNHVDSILARRRKKRAIYASPCRSAETRCQVGAGQTLYSSIGKRYATGRINTLVLPVQPRFPLNSFVLKTITLTKSSLCLILIALSVALSITIILDKVFRICSISSLLNISGGLQRPSNPITVSRQIKISSREGVSKSIITMSVIVSD